MYACIFIDELKTKFIKFLNCNVTPAASGYNPFLGLEAEKLQLSGFTLNTPPLLRQKTAQAPCGLSLKVTQNHMYLSPSPHTEQLFEHCD